MTVKDGERSATTRQSPDLRLRSLPISFQYDDSTERVMGW
jgi:hypothetical protein